MLVNDGTDLAAELDSVEDGAGLQADNANIVKTAANLLLRSLHIVTSLFKKQRLA